MFFKKFVGIATALVCAGLCAPGTEIDSFIATGTGTSFSAPHVTGAVALLCEAKPVLKIRQDVVKAILSPTIIETTKFGLSWIQ